MKDIGKAYKSLVTRWNHDKHSSKKHNSQNCKASDGVKQADKWDDPTTPAGKNDDSYHFSRSSSVLSQTTSRRSHTPTPSLTRSTSRSSNMMDNSFKRSTSTKRALSTPRPSDFSTRKLTSQNSNVNNLSRSTSRRSTTPIIFSQSNSTIRRKPHPTERKLECSLEELCFGTIKQVMVTRDAISDVGIIVQEEELLQINVHPGWKKGTKITFEGKGDEKPGYLPADLVFLIEEKRHPVFKRVGEHDLELGIEVPLLKALVGFKVSVPLLGGEKMLLKIDDVIHPGYEKVISEQGMPKSHEDTQRGELRLTFLINFPRELSDEQRAKIYKILKSCF